MDHNLFKVSRHKKKNIFQKYFEYIAVCCFGIVFINVVYLMTSSLIEYKTESRLVLVLKSNASLIQAKSNDLNIQFKQLEQSKIEIIDQLYSKKLKTMVDQGELDIIINKEKEKTHTLETLRTSKGNVIRNYKEKEALIEEIKALSLQIEKIKETMGHINDQRGGHNDKQVHLMNSLIIFPDQRDDFFNLLDFGSNKRAQLELLYRMSQDGFKASIFHDKCDMETITLSLLKLDDGTIIGGYTERSWGGFGYKTDDYAFIFNFNMKKKYKIRVKEKAIFPNPDYLVVFGEGDIYIREHLQTSIFPQSYGQLMMNEELTGGKTSFSLQELEVFRVVFHNPK